MSRTARFIPRYGYLHIMSRGNNRQRIFSYARDYRFYCSCLRKLKAEESVKIHHYCLMPNHLHLLLGVGPASNVGRFMQRLGLKYFYYYRARRDYIGHLLQGRFKSKIIVDEKYFLQCGKYIELNPVRAQLVSFPEEYAYSSYRHYALGGEDEIVDDDFFYLSLHNDATRRKELYSNMLFDEKGCAKQLHIDSSNLMFNNELIE